MSFMKKMAVGVQFLKVKAGKAEQSEEDPEFVARMGVYDCDKIALKQLEYDLGQEAARLQAALDGVEKKSDNLDKIAHYAGSSNATYEAAVKGQAAADRASVSSLRKRLNALKDLLLDPTRVLVKEHLATAHKLKQRYRETHLALDAANGKYAKAKEGEPKQKAQVAVDEAQREYNEAKDNFLRQLDVMEGAKDTVLRENMPKYRDAKAAYHREMAEISAGSPQ